MEKIASTPQYEISVDIDKNRITVKIIGFWNSPDLVPYYVADWKKALSKIKPNFTILADLREMKTHPRAVMPLHDEAMQLTKKAKCGFSADVIKDDIADMQMNHLYKTHNAKNNKYATIEEATEYLDNCIIEE